MCSNKSRIGSAAADAADLPVEDEPSGEASPNGATGKIRDDTLCYPSSRLHRPHYLLQDLDDGGSYNTG